MIETDHVMQTGFDDYTSRLDIYIEKMRSEIGAEFPVWESRRSNKDNLNEILLKGYPSVIFDTLEVFPMTFSQIGDSPEKDSISFEKEVNRIFREENFPWQMASGMIYKIESDYFAEEVYSEVHKILNLVQFDGAEKHFNEARSFLTEKDSQKAMFSAYLALEQTKKGVLGKKYDTAREGNLNGAICSETFLPTFYQTHLEKLKDFLIASDTLNQKARHAEGSGVPEIPLALAELSINWVAAIIQFLTKNYMEKNNIELLTEEQEIIEEPRIIKPPPFDDDDIPF